MIDNRLKEFRTKHGLLQKDLAKKTGYCTRTISRVERGDEIPNLEFAFRMAAYFGVRIEDIFEFST